MLLLLTPILLLLLTPAIMASIRLRWPKFAYFWLVAAAGALLAWPLILMARPEAAVYFPLIDWQPQDFFLDSPALLLDHISWSFALSLGTLALAVILTDVTRATAAEWQTWAGSLVLASLGLLAVLAGNPLTLLLAWTALDLIELVILLSQVLPSRMRERIVISYSARVAGIGLLLWAWMITNSDPSPGFEAVTGKAGLFLLLAAGLRLGVLPLHIPFLNELPLRRSLGTILRLVPAAASLMLLARTAQVGVSAPAAAYLLGLAGLAALYGSASFASAEDELDGRPFWIMSLASFALASAVRGQSEATLAWGIAALLSGGMLFLFSPRQKFLSFFLILGALGISTFPFTQSWQGLELYAAPFSPFMALFLIAQATLLVGYLGHSFRPAERLEGVERWVWVIYPWGLALFPLTHFLVVWFRRSSIQAFPSLVQSWPALVILGLSAIFVFWAQRGPSLPPNLFSTLGRIFSFVWLYRLLWRGYQLTARLVAAINLILEGEGGLLWTLLLLTILFSVLVQQGGG